MKTVVTTDARGKREGRSPATPPGGRCLEVHGAGHRASAGQPRLYQNRGRFRFPCGRDDGLVCFLEDDQRIGEVTRQSIEIIGPPPKENRLRFYNPDVDQPWLKKNTSGP